MGFSEWAKKVNEMSKDEIYATINVDEVTTNNNWMTIRWSGVLGFGEVRFHFTNSDNGLKVKYDSECMSRDFVINLLLKMVLMSEDEAL